MQELQRDLTGKGVVWLLVNSVGPNHPGHRSPQAARKEWAAEKIQATAWLDDSSGAIGKAYGMRTRPHLFKGVSGHFDKSRCRRTCSKNSSAMM